MTCDPRVTIQHPQRPITITRAASPSVVVTTPAATTVVDRQHDTTTVSQPQTDVVVQHPVHHVVARVKRGPQGPPGKDGTGGDLHYHHVQATPAAVWVIAHGLGKYPAISIVDSGGSTVIGDVKYDTTDQCTVAFSAAFSGEAFCN